MLSSLTETNTSYYQTKYFSSNINVLEKKKSNKLENEMYFALGQAVKAIVLSSWLWQNRKVKLKEQKKANGEDKEGRFHKKQNIINEKKV